MEQSSDDKNPLPSRSRAVLCEECKSKCAKGKEPPHYSIANGWHLGINMRSLLPRLTVMELCAIRLVRVFRKIVKVVGASSTVAITGHVITLNNESCLDRENCETWESIHAPKSDDTGTPMVPFLSAADVSIVFIGKHDFWNKLLVSIQKLTVPELLNHIVVFSVLISTILYYGFSTLRFFHSNIMIVSSTKP